MLKLHIRINSLQREIAHHLHEHRLDLQQRKCSSGTRPRAVDKRLNGKRIGRCSSGRVPSIRVEDLDVCAPDCRIVLNHGGNRRDGGALWDGHARNDDVFARFPRRQEGWRVESQTLVDDAVEIGETVDGCCIELGLLLLSRQDLVAQSLLYIWVLTERICSPGESPSCGLMAGRDALNNLGWPC